MKTIMKGNLKATLAALYTAYLSVLATPSLVNATNTYDFGADFSGDNKPQLALIFDVHHGESTIGGFDV